jgi:hypothetical protein
MPKVCKKKLFAFFSKEKAIGVQPQPKQSEALQ